MKLIQFSAAMLAFSAVAAPAFCQPTFVFEQAEQAARSGDAAGMEQAYSDILQTNPNDVRALTGRATARSWQGKRADARSDYKAALALDPNHLDALVGLGYDYAWGGDHAQAELSFERALVLAPDLLSARKGLAQTALWSGRSHLALSRFDEIAADFPNEAEVLRGIAQARLALGQAGRAESSFERVLRVAPGDRASLDGMRAARTLPALVEASAWIGNSAEGGDIGLRAAEIASWVTPDTRVGLRYDNSLSLDNPALARQGVDADAWFIGVQKNLKQKVIAVAEVGKRDLPGGVDQEVYKLEGVVLDGQRNYKLGAQLSPTNAGYDDQLVYAGIGLPVADRVRLDATVFASRSGVSEDEEIRGVVFGEYVSPKGWTIGAGAGVGDVSSNIPGASGSVTTANILATLPVRERHSVYLQARWEDAPLTDYSSVMVGFTVRLPRP